MNRSFWSLLLLSAAFLSLSAFAQPTYRITQLAGDPTVPGFANPIISDLNDRGEFVGMLDVEGRTRAMYWRGDGTRMDIGDLLGGAADYAEALGINNRGEIVGVSMAGPNRIFRGFLWREGRMTELPYFPDAFTFGFKINLARQILGDTSPQGAFLARGSSVQILPALPGGGDSRAPFRMNEWGMIVGSSDSSAGRRAALWWLGKVLDLGTLPGGTASNANDINNLTQVVGGSTSTVTRPFLWQFGRMTELPMIHSGDSAWSAVANSINDRGQIVGTESFTFGVDRVPLLWERGAVYDLNELVDSADPLRPFVTILLARLINNRGDIIVQGLDSRAPQFRGPYYLLTPLPQ